MPPRISGSALKAAAHLATTRLGSLASYQALRADLHIDGLAALPESARGNVPLHNRARQGRPPRGATCEDAGLDAPAPAGPWPLTISRLQEAYRDGRTDPVAVVDRVLAGARELAARQPSIGPFLADRAAEARREAEDSRTRLRDGRGRGPLEGIPYAVKEEAGVAGLLRQSGTSFEEPDPQPEDATVVARLRAVGAILVATTPMTEYGFSPLGQNARRTMPKNPHHPGYTAGGSSTGSGVAVATGVVPLALGVDGGGSVRIPASINGVFGIKPTWGRVSRCGFATTGSVGHLGPLTCSSVDLALALEHIAGPDPRDEETDRTPSWQPGELLKALGRGVRGLRIGVDAREWADAHGDVARAGQAALSALEREGAVLVPLRLELARFAAPIGCLTLGPEARANLRSSWAEHASDMSLDLRITMAALGQVSAVDYTDAQRLRSGLRAEMARTFEDVDLLALPSTATTAGAATEAEMRSGFLDTALLTAMVRFMFLGNLTGLPAASAPVGRDARNLPIGLQLLGDAWDEATVLAAVAHLERIGVACVERPQAHVTLL